jgi:hypothetical protein
VLQDKGFHFLGCREISRASGALVEIEYGLEPTGAAAKWDPSLRKSKVTLDPGADWRVVNSATTQDRQDTDQQIEYLSDRATPAVANKVTEHYVDLPQRGVVGTDVFENTFVSFDPPPSSEFYLPSIGLPEVSVDKVALSPSSRLWLIGLIFVVVGGVLYAIVARRKPGTGPQ